MSATAAYQLCLACKDGDLEKVKCLLQQQEEESWVLFAGEKKLHLPLYKACLSGHFDIVHLLIEHHGGLSR